MRKIISISAALLLLLFFVIVPAFAGEGDDENESNDTRALADSIDGLLIEGNMDENDGDDWFVLEGQEGTHPTFTLEFDEDELEVDFEIFSGEEVAGSSAAYGSPDIVSCEVPGECYVHVWWWSGDGDYTIAINSLSQDCAGDDEIEPNNDKDLADSVDGMEINGYMCESDEDWFVLEGQEGTEPTFTMRFDDEELEIDWEIYSGDEVVETMSDWGSPEHVTVDVPGTCYIHVWWWSGEGEYTIEIDD
jgi:hypothetical protein